MLVMRSYLELHADFTRPDSPGRGPLSAEVTGTHFRPCRAQQCLVLSRVKKHTQAATSKWRSFGLGLTVEVAAPDGRFR